MIDMRSSSATPPALLAEVTRGNSVESVHYGVIAAVDTAGRLVASVGDPERFAYFRSSAKPFQAIPLIETGAADAFGFTPAELALCCASHHASRRHQSEVATMLSKLGLTEAALQCGIVTPSDRQEAARIATGLVPPSPLQCDCSGKHTGMLTTCLHLGYSIDTYLDPEHPLQRQIRAIMAEVMRMDERDLSLATDGCSVPTFGASVRAFATAYAALAAPDQAPAGQGREHAAALNRLRSAMIAHPENVAGTNALATNLMALSRGSIVAKGGAEGLMCLAIPERGLGIAIRVADGTFRSHPAIILAVLEQLDLMPASIIAAIREHHPAAVRNHNHLHVGDIRAAFQIEPR